MRAPGFWRHDSVLAELLLPFSVMYFLLLKLRLSLIKQSSVKAKVICLGNITAGGAGKTPSAMAIATILKKQKKKFAFISKGYGGRTKKPTKVNHKKHSANEVGDEPLLLSRVGPCWVGKSRVETAKAAIKDGARILILDDGLQDPSLKKDLSVLVVDGNYGFGNKFIMPAGPLRGHLTDTIKSCDVVLFIGNDSSDTIAVIRKHRKNIIRADLRPKKSINKNLSYLAFAGIGNPEKFSDTLQKLGAEIKMAIAYPDHHSYTIPDIKYLKKQARELGATLVTTEKDMVKIPHEMQDDIVVVPVELSFRNNTKIESLLKKIMK